MIRVSIIASDGEADSEPLESRELAIVNTPPQIVTWLVKTNTICLLHGLALRTTGRRYLCGACLA